MGLASEEIGSVSSFKKLTGAYRAFLGTNQIVMVNNESINDNVDSLVSHSWLNS